MKRNEIMAIIRSLAKSQGFYCRVLEAIESAENKEEILCELENQNFKDAVDLVMYFG